MPALVRGFVLLPVILMIIVVASIALMLNQQGLFGAHSVNAEVAGERGQYIAEAGLKHALWQTTRSACGPYANIPSTAFDGGSYSFTITPNTASSVSHYTVGVIDDAWIASDAPSQNHGSHSELRTYAMLLPSTNHRALYRFDLENSGIPAGATVISAVVKLFVLDANDFAPITLHRVVEDWTEDTVNWNNIYTGYDVSALASIPAGSTAGQYVSVNITSIVQSWLNGAISNNGVLLKSGAQLDLAKFTSKEFGSASQRPKLEITVAGGELANRASIQSVGTIGGAVARTLTRDDVVLVQEPSNIVWQANAALDDTWTWDGNHAPTNFGASPILSINTFSAERTILIRFNTMVLPPGAQVSSAKLNLYLEGGLQLNNGVIDLHRVTQSWVEGIYNDQTPPPGGGASYNSYDGQTNWVNPGGDYDAALIDSVTIPDLSPGWYQWDFSSQLQAWLAGEPNLGVLLRSSAGLVEKINFTSSDSTTELQRPSLTITFSCECGITCEIPQGEGNILLVVGNDTALDKDDEYKRTLFESWGYSVTLIDDESTQADFDTNFSNNDVAYVSQTALDINLHDKLKLANIGVVNEQGEQNSELGTSAAQAWDTAASINIVDNTHYVTGQLPLGDLPIYRAPMEVLQAAGPQAPSLQTLGEFDGNPGLALVESGGSIIGGNIAAGRRVMLPLGRHHSFDWNYLNNNGRLIVQRSLQWGTGNTLVSPKPQLYLSTDNNSNLGGQSFDELDIVEYVPEAATASLFFDGGAANLDETMDAFHLLANGNILFSTDRDGSIAGLNFKDGDLVDYDPQADTASVYFDDNLFGIAANVRSVFVMSNRHLLLSTDRNTTLGGLAFTNKDLVEYDIATDTATLFFDASTTTLNSPIDAVYLLENGNMLLSTVDDANLGGLSFKDGDIVEYNPSNDTASLYFDEQEYAGGPNTTGVHEGPGTGELWVDGQNLLMVVTDPAALTAQETLKKELIHSWSYNVNYIDVNASQATFDAAVANNDLAFVSEDINAASLNSKLLDASIGVVFEEAGLSDDFGLAQSVGWDAGTEIQIDDNSHYITRPFAPGALSILNNSEALAYVSGFEAPDLTKLASSTSGSGLVLLDTGDVTLGAGTAAARRAQLPWGGDSMDVNSLNADGLTLFQRALSWAGGAGCDGTYRDEFNQRQYDNNDGSLVWSTNWLETDDDDSATNGNIRISNDIDNYQLWLRKKQKMIERGADLSASASATLSFDYRRVNLENAAHFVAIEVSYDGGSNWNELDRFIGPADDVAYISTSYGLDAASLSEDTRIRFKTANNGMDDSNQVWVDDVQIECVP
ncbi:MAG: DNRLRE domain-containing protein [Pseudomonadales bacterium]|nr:DNRLRE domain-containing protein [Pseudomonadales bacterium]